MEKTWGKVLVACSFVFAFLIASVISVKDAHAVAQWSRKYKINCQTCHTSFPRLTYYGEKFQRNGFQMPDTEDGDENKEKLNDTTFVDNLINMFGVRVSLSAVSVTTNGLTRDGGSKTRTAFGNTDWVQLFSAGSIFKNTSIFIETELANTTVKNNWFTLGYHNLFGTNLLNIRAGKLSVMNWHGQSGRLRMIPNIQIEGWKNVLTSEGTAAATVLEDQVAIGEPQPGIEIYGYKGPFLYSTGVVNGNTLNDGNQFKNFFGTLRLEMPEGALEGSSISGNGYWGTDTATTSTSQVKNRFYRASGAVNLRWKKFDVIGSYLWGRDNDWVLSTAGDQKNTTQAFSGQVGYMINSKWFAAGQYDYVTDTFKNTATTSNYYHKASPSIWFMPRENMRIGFVNRMELKGRDGGRQHEFLVHVRAMF